MSSMNEARTGRSALRGAWLAVCAAAGLLAAGLTRPACGQNSSLYQPGMVPVEGPALTLPETSWTFRQLPPPREIRINDLVTIRVDEKSQSIAEGNVQRRKNSSYDALLKDWVELEGLKALRAAPQEAGDPRAQAQLNSLFRAQSNLQTREALKFDITATVVDIRPNGTLVLEAHKRIRNGEEFWDYSLSGLCRREDIAPNNVILSQNIAEMALHKVERGSVVDGYRRGWFQRVWDLFKVF